MNDSLSSLLSHFPEQLQRKSYLHVLMVGWERRVGIVAEDRQVRFCLVFTNGRMEIISWHEEQTFDLVLSGEERDLCYLFAGDELDYLRAKELIRVKGTLRDQLKLEALIRLSCAGLRLHSRGKEVKRKGVARLNSFTM